MRKLIDTLAVLSFLMSAGMLTGTLLLYSRLPSIISQAKSQATEMVTDLIPGVGGELPSLGNSGDSKLPTQNIIPKF